MTFEEAREAVLNLLREQGRAKNSEMQAALGGDSALLERVREDLIFNDLAQDKSGVGLVIIGKPAMAEAKKTEGAPATASLDPLRPPPRRRVFVSYGRADASGLARRLSEELKGRGHAVWIDEREMLPGDSWEEQIERAILESEVLVALLTPHAVRRPDGVCLDEISLARYSQLRIIPVMVIHCRPPLGIYRLDWIDFHEWQTAARYEQAFARLLASLEQDQETVEGVHARLFSRLKPLDFGVELSRLQRDFTGRGWLLGEMEAWLKEDVSRVFFITGDPGTGKSAAMARLAGHHPLVAAYHLCVSGLADSLDPLRFVSSIAAQLLTQLPEYRLAVEALDLDTASPSDPGSLLRRLVADPLHKMTQREPVLILVDALDEALTYGTGNIAQLLAERLEDMPPWVRLVVSSRKEPEVMDLFSAFRPHEIDAGRDENLADVAVFLQKKLCESALAKRLERAGVDGQAAAALISDRGAGNFLYVTQVLDAIRSGQVDLRAPTSFPEGLVGIYHGFFDRLFPQGRGYAEFRPLLEVLVAAREPLSAPWIARLLNRDRFDVENDLERVAAFFPARQGTYSVFHKSISDWLSGQAGQSRRFRLDVEAGHSRLADTLLASYGAGEREPFVLKHLMSHLSSAGRWPDVERVLTDLGFVEAKCAAGMTYELIAEYNSALSRAGWPEAARERIEEFARFVRTRSHVLALRSRLTFAQAANEPDCTAPAEAARRRSESGVETRPWLRWLNKPQVSRSACLLRLLGPGCGFNACAWSPDGKCLVTGADDGSLAIWDAETGAQLRRLSGHAGGITAVACSQDGSRVVSASNDGSVRVWSVMTGAERMVLPGHTKQASSCAVSPDGRYVASGGADGTLRIWDAETGAPVWSTRPRFWSVLCCAFSPDGRFVASGSQDTTIAVWDVRTGALQATLDAHESEVRGCAFSPDGRTLVSASADGTLRLWDLESAEVKATLKGHTGEVNGCAFSHDGRWIVSAGAWDRSLRLWDGHTGKEVAALAGHTWWVNACAFSPDDRRVASASTDKSVRIWDVEIALRTPIGRVGYQSDGDVTLADQPAHSPWASACAFSPEGARLASGSWDGTVKLWHATTGRLIGTLDGHGGEVHACAFSPDGTALVSALKDGTLRIWDVASGREIGVLKGHSAGVRTCAFSPDGRLIVSAAEDWTLRLWDFATGREEQVLKGHANWVTSCAFSPDGLFVLSASYDKTLRVWDAANGTCLSTLAGHGDFVNGCCYSPDGALVASASSDRTVRIWDVRSGTVLSTLTGYELPVLHCAFSPDGRLVATACWDRSLKIRDVGTGADLCEHRADTKACVVAWSPDGTNLLAGCVDGSVHLMAHQNLPLGRLLVTPWQAVPTSELAVGCPSCRNWSSLPQQNRGLDIDCPKCGRPLKANPFVIRGDWPSVAAAWQHQVQPD